VEIRSQVEQGKMRGNRLYIEFATASPFGPLLPFVERKRHNLPGVKYWEIIADNLRKAVGVGVVSQPWILAGEQCGLETHVAATVSASLCVWMKS
jgi:hypothetical protein